MTETMISAAPQRRTFGSLSGPSILFVPLAIMLLLIHIGPMVWFLFRTFADADQGLIRQIEDVLLSAEMLKVLWITLWTSFLVTFLALLLAYPIAYSLCKASRFGMAAILACVIVPYFTSVIVRTYSWMVLLGRNGIVNRLLLDLGIIDEPLRLMYNQGGVLIGMVYVLLPYLVLTLYAAMKSIDTNLLLAARGMGASGAHVFLKVFWPLSLPGVISGCLIVYILAVGFFITPALMGSSNDIMIAMLIQREVEVNLNWGLAAVLSLLLLTLTMALYILYCRYTDIDRMMGKH